MKSTVDKYGALIQNDKINPAVDVNPLGSGVIFDPADEQTPLQVIGLGIYKLNGEIYQNNTGAKEYAFVPMEGTFVVKTEEGEFHLEREGGPFNVAPGASNASALYVPKESSYTITGHGEIIYYTAPSSQKMKTVFISQGQVPNLSRGDLLWRRDVITMIEPGISTNLIVGETYSPPGLWSGTPLHVHDVGDVAAGESEHEEVYYHVSRMKGREMPNFTVQMLFDGKEINKAYLCQDKTAFAIPGVCHPVVASPVSDCIYGWALAGVEGHLGMRDVADFAHMKKIGEFASKLRSEEANQAALLLDRVKLSDFSAANGLDEFQTKIVELILREYGINFKSL
ncbi:5-dehydro-4-deoxy-D-glucuronate isomerase [Acididesulfobacillus acetoxydans]|uniref:5-dehydro-4-deoxy-D-glucuronate isomerase n=1 Tax=Acididesulfobacillus acetoxydans TaxID=1561005 RepID=A0A8S0WA91_9FIRM|nr:5-deoxy-glucuronate isomerase [Acididesulfobacillus acetoxydans]CAA7603249.1 5-dehydro-4-deoxy-D-glucuronate isomerase [Acididesulfobacillus acetoxydans]CEJ06036.1 5-dehydro-4-deoxy-D-glucuronate isomerase [Acididesulfobacillus acetoxydans]